MHFANQTTPCFVVQPIIYLNISQTTNEGLAGCDTKKGRFHFFPPEIHPGDFKSGICILGTAVTM